MEPKDSPWIDAAKKAKAVLARRKLKFIASKAAEDGAHKEGKSSQLADIVKSATLKPAPEREDFFKADQPQKEGSCRKTVHPPLLIQYPEIPKFSFDQIFQLLNDENVKANNEKDVLDAITAWLDTNWKKDSGDSGQTLISILSCLRFQLLTPHQLAGTIEPLVKAANSKELEESLAQAYRYHALKESGSICVPKCPKLRGAI